MARSNARKVAPPVPGIYVQKASFRYAVGYETSESRDCDEGSCSGMCRCSKINRAWITSTESVGPSCLTFVTRHPGEEKLEPYKPSRFETYCIQRLMVHHGCYNADCYEPQIANGLYGQEVSQIIFSNLSELSIDACKMLALPTDHAKLMFVFNLEYGLIADIVKDTDSVELVTLELGNIQPSAGALMLRRQKTYFHTLNSDSIVGVVMENLLIDGNHRYSYLVGEHGKAHKAVYINLFSTVMNLEG